MEKYNKALEYEICIKKEYSFADEAIKQAKVIFDIGGHIGLFSTYCLSLNSWCEIHYFEPIPELYNQAKQTVKNQNIIMNNFGIAAKTWEQKMYFNPQKTMQSSKFNNTFLNPKGKEILVQMQNIEEYCVQKNISHIDLMKIDVEGMEYEILESLSDEFLGIITSLVIEYHCFTKEDEQKKETIKKRLTPFFKIKTMCNPYNKNIWYFYAMEYSCLE